MFYLAPRLILAALAAPAAGLAQVRTDAPAPDKAVDEVVVTAPTGGAAEVVTSIDRKSYSATKEVAASAGVLADLLRTLPSVDVDAQGNVSLRGDTGVVITIDGKPAGMFQGQSRGQAVQSLPADQFERVEVITNPSAAESAEGGAGVINLVSKTARKAGASGSARISVGTLGQYNSGATLAYNAAKLAVNGDVSYRGGDPQTFRTLDVRREISPAGAETGHLVDTRYWGVGHIFTSRIGADYDLDDKTRVGAQVRYTGVGASQPGLELREDDDPLGRPTLSRRDIGQSPFSFTDTEGSLNFRRKLGADQEITGDLRQERTVYASVRPDRTWQADGAVADVFTRYVTELATNTTGAKANYQRTLAGGDELKAGYDLRIDDSNYFSIVARGPSPAELAEDTGFSGAFGVRQTVNAAFLTWQHKFDDLTLLGGLRLEDARTSVAALGGPAETTDRLRPFPSLHLSYALGSDRTLTGSYSRRVSRPPLLYLTPVVSYRSERAIYRGNPDLKPSETDSFELSYEDKGKAGSLTATLFWRRIHDDMSMVTRQLDDGLIVTSPENLGLSQRGGASASLNRKLTSTFTATLNGDLYWAQLRGGDLGSPTRSGLSGTGRANLSWQATPADLLQLNIQATGRAKTSQGEKTGYAVVNLGYRRRLTPSLFAVVSAQNLTGGWRQAEVVRTPTLVYRQTMFGLPRTVTFGLNYTFGVAKKPPAPPAFDFGGAPPS